MQKTCSAVEWLPLTAQTCELGRRFCQYSELLCHSWHLMDCSIWRTVWCFTSQSWLSCTSYTFSRCQVQHKIDVLRIMSFTIKSKVLSFKFKYVFLKKNKKKQQLWFSFSWPLFMFPWFPYIQGFLNVLVAAWLLLMFNWFGILHDIFWKTFVFLPPPPPQPSTLRLLYPLSLNSKLLQLQVHKITNSAAIPTWEKSLNCHILLSDIS